MTYLCDQYFESLKSALYFWSGTSIIVFAVYWILAGIYTIIDITKQPAALGRYKVQPGTNEQVDSKRLMKVCTECVYLKQIYLNTNTFGAWNDIGWFNELLVLSTFTFCIPNGISDVSGWLLKKVFRLSKYWHFISYLDNFLWMVLYVIF